MRRTKIISCCCLFVGFLLLSVIFLCDHVVYGSEVRGVTKDTIKVGIIMDMTGPAAAQTPDILNASKNYIRHVNDEGGVNGREIKLLLEDSRYTVPAALAAFKKLVFKDKVFHIMGTVSSHGSRALLSRCKASKVTMTPYVAPKALVEPLNRYTFISVSNYGDQAEVTADYIMKEMDFDKPRIAIVYCDNPYGKDYLTAAIEYLKLYGVKPVDKQVINPGAMDATTQLFGLKRAGATHIMFQGIESGITAFLREMKKYKYTPYVFGNYAACTEIAIKRIPDMAPYYFGNSVFSSWYEDTPGMGKVREITLKYHPGTERPYRTKLYTLGWAVSVILAEGLKKAGKNLSTETLIDALESLKDFDTGGVIAPIPRPAINQIAVPQSIRHMQRRGNSYALGVGENRF